MPWRAFVLAVSVSASCLRKRVCASAGAIVEVERKGRSEGSREGRRKGAREESAGASAASRLAAQPHPRQARAGRQAVQWL